MVLFLLLISHDAIGQILIGNSPGRGFDLDPTPTVTIRDLGQLDNQDTLGVSINNQGSVVGVAYSSTGGTSAFFWSSRTGFIKIAGAAASAASDINDRGQVVGYYIANDGSARGFLWTAKTGLFEDLEGLLPSAINDRGEIAGNCLDEGISNPCVFADGHVKLIDLGDAAYPGSAFVLDINNHGVVVGNFFPVLAPRSRAFTWSERKGITVLQIPAGFLESYGRGINNAGMVSGMVSNDAEFGDVFATIWTRHGSVQAVFSTPLLYGAGAAPMNAYGWMLLDSSELWIRRQGPVVLPALDGGSEELAAMGLNDKGQIVGWSTDTTRALHLVMWTVRRGKGPDSQ